MTKKKSGCIFKPSSRFSLQLCRACRTSTCNRIPVLRLFIFNSVCALGAISYSAHPLNCEGLTKTPRLCAESPVPQERVTIKIHFADSLLIAVHVLWGYAAQRATKRNVNAIVQCLNFTRYLLTAVCMEALLTFSHLCNRSPVSQRQRIPRIVVTKDSYFKKQKMIKQIKCQNLLHVLIPHRVASKLTLQSVMI